MTETTPAGAVEIPPELQQEMLDLSVDTDEQQQLFEKHSTQRLVHQNKVKANHKRVDEILRIVRGEPLLNQADADVNPSQPSLPMQTDGEAAPAGTSLVWLDKSDEEGYCLAADSILCDEDGSGQYEYRIRPHDDEGQMSIAASSESLIQHVDRLIYTDLEFAKRVCGQLEEEVTVADPNLEDVPVTAAAE